MTFLAVKDLKKTKELWRKLEEDKELVITCEGQPRALMVPVTAENFEEQLRVVRRARLGDILKEVREKAKQHPITEAEIEAEIQAVRRGNRKSNSK